MRGYLARISLILALCRCAESGGVEQVEAEDVDNAAVIVAYFQTHARRVYGKLGSVTREDLLAGELRALLEDHGGEWRGTATELYAELEGRGASGLSGERGVVVEERARHRGQHGRADRRSRVSRQGANLEARPGKYRRYLRCCRCILRFHQRYRRYRRQTRGRRVMNEVGAVFSEVYAAGARLVVLDGGLAVDGKIPDALRKKVRAHREGLLEALVGDPLEGVGWEARTALYRQALRWLDGEVEKMGPKDAPGAARSHRCPVSA